MFSAWLHTLTTHVDYTQCLPTLTTYVDYIRWLHTLITHVDYIGWLHTLTTYVDYTSWLYTLTTHIDYPRSLHTLTTYVHYTRSHLFIILSIKSVPIYWFKNVFKIISGLLFVERKFQYILKIHNCTDCLWSYFVSLFVIIT